MPRPTMPGDEEPRRPRKPPVPVKVEIRRTVEALMTKLFRPEHLGVIEAETKAELVSLLAKGLAQNLRAVECLLRRQADRGDGHAHGPLDESEEKDEMLTALPLKLQRAVLVDLKAVADEKSAKRLTKALARPFFDAVPSAKIYDSIRRCEKRLLLEGLRIRVLRDLVLDFGAKKNEAAKMSELAIVKRLTKIDFDLSATLHRLPRYEDDLPKDDFWLWLYRRLKRRHDRPYRVTRFIDATKQPPTGWKSDNE